MMFLIRFVVISFGLNPYQDLMKSLYQRQTIMLGGSFPSSALLVAALAMISKVCVNGPTENDGVIAPIVSRADTLQIIVFKRTPFLTGTWTAASSLRLLEIHVLLPLISPPHPCMEWLLLLSVISPPHLCMEWLLVLPLISLPNLSTQMPNSTMSLSSNDSGLNLLLVACFPPSVDANCGSNQQGKALFISSNNERIVGLLLNRSHDRRLALVSC